jgi:hypothetical protein
MVVRNVAHNGKAQPSSSGLSGTRLVNTIEPFEYSVEIRSRDPDALVDDDNFDPSLVATDAHPHEPTFVAVFDGVLDEVAEGGAQLCPVGANPQSIHYVDGFDSDMVTISCHPASGHGFSDDGRQVDFVVEMMTQLNA